MAGLQDLVGSLISVVEKRSGRVTGAFIAKLECVEENRLFFTTEVFDQRVEHPTNPRIFYLGFDPPHQTIEIVRLYPPSPLVWWPKQAGQAGL